MADTEFDVNIVVNESVNPDVGSTEYEGGLSVDDSVLNLSAESSEDTIVDAEVVTTESIEAVVDGGTGGTQDHRQLTHRDATNQHPISAIQGLTSTLENIVDHIDSEVVAITGRISSTTDIAQLARKYNTPEYALSNSNVTAPEDGWSSNIPTLTETYPYLWQRISTYEKAASGNDLYISSTTPELANTMSGLYVFMKQAHDGSATVINGGSIIAETLTLTKLVQEDQDIIDGKAEQTSLDATNTAVSSLDEGVNGTAYYTDGTHTDIKHDSNGYYYMNNGTRVSVIEGDLLDESGVKCSVSGNEPKADYRDGFKQDVSSTNAATNSSIESIASRVGANETSISSISSSVNTNSQAISSASSSISTINADISTLQEGVSAISQITDYVEVIPSVKKDKMIVISSTEPSVKISAITEAQGQTQKNEVKITDSVVSFNINNTQNVAYLTGQTFAAPNLQATQIYMRTRDEYGDPIGELGWVARSNGHLSLKALNGGD